MTSFTTTFGNSPVSPANVAYREFSIASNTTLVWPEFSYGNSNVIARFMRVTATDVSLALTLPDATLVSNGMDILVYNAGSETFNISDSSGSSVTNIAAGEAYYFVLRSNTTAGGSWQLLQFGTGTSYADANSLAGNGLKSIGGTLNTGHTALQFSVDRTFVVSDRAKLYAWSGGAGVATLPYAATATDSYFFLLSNIGTGDLVITPIGGEVIDGTATSTLTTGQSCFVVTDGTAWYSVGKGVPNTFFVTLLNKNVAGSADVTLTSAEAANIIQQYTGALTASIDVIVPATPQLYFVYNNTTGSYTLTVTTAAGTGIICPQGDRVILYCDGTDIVNAYASVPGGTITFNAGNQAAPSINFQGNTDTGLYSYGVSQMGVTAAGTTVGYFASTGWNGSVAGAVTGNVTGNLTGNVTGSVSGTAANVTGTVAIINGGTGATSAAAARTALGAGTVTSITAGTGLTGGTITTTGTIAVDVGTTANKIVQLDGTGKLPAIDGSQLTGITVFDKTSITGQTEVVVAVGDSFVLSDVSDSGNLKRDTVQGVLDLVSKLSTASGTAPSYSTRAWVVFNGTRNVGDTGASTNGQPVLIIGSGNVSSVTKNATGDFTVNYTTALPNANYATNIMASGDTLTNYNVGFVYIATAPSTSATRIATTYVSGGSPTAVDRTRVSFTAIC